MLERLTGFVLKRRRVGEADLIVHILEEEGRVLELKAHGLLASRRRSNLIAEPGSLISAVYYKKEGLGSLKEGQILERYEDVKEGYLNLLILAYVLELTESAARNHETSGIFPLLKGALSVIRESLADWKVKTSGKTDDPRSPDSNRLRWSGLFLAFYKIRLLKLLGILADTSCCTECAESLEAEAFWSFPETGFICHRCSINASREEGVMARLITLAGVRRFSNFLLDIRSVLSGNILTDDALDIIIRLDQRLGKCLEYYYNRPLASGPPLYRELLKFRGGSANVG